MKCDCLNCMIIGPIRPNPEEEKRKRDKITKELTDAYKLARARGELPEKFEYARS